MILFKELLFFNDFDFISKGFPEFFQILFELGIITSMDNLNLLIADNLNVLQKLVQVQLNIFDLYLSQVILDALVDIVEGLFDVLRLSPRCSPHFCVISNILRLKFLKVINRNKCLFEFLIALQHVDQNLIILLLVNVPVLVLGINDSPFLRFLLFKEFFNFFINLIWIFFIFGFLGFDRLFFFI